MRVRAPGSRFLHVGPGECACASRIRFPPRVPLLARFLDMPTVRRPAARTTCRGSRDPTSAHPSASASRRDTSSDGYSHMPGGESGHPLSPFYRAGFDAWAQGRPTPLLPGPATHDFRCPIERELSRGDSGVSEPVPTQPRPSAQTWFTGQTTGLPAHTAAGIGARRVRRAALLAVAGLVIVAVRVAHAGRWCPHRGPASRARLAAQSLPTAWCRAATAAAHVRPTDRRRRRRLPRAATADSQRDSKG